MDVFRLATVFLLVLFSSCTVRNVESPVSPSTPVTPSTDVIIGAPRIVLPASGARLTRDAHPITLTIENTSTSGSRPLSYSYEGSSDPAFAAQVFKHDGVAPGGNGRTSIDVAGPLPSGRTYYWRVRAVDGINTGPYSETAHFVVFETLVLAAPVPTTPMGGATVESLQPTLRTSNAGRSGPAEPVSYNFDVSLSDQFTTVAFALRVTEQVDQTEVTVTPLQAAHTYYWRVRATSASATSPWSAPHAFRTPGGSSPAPPAPPPGLPPSNPGLRPNPSEGTAMVAAVIADLAARGISTAGDCGAFEITRRVAWAFRNRGAGLEFKPGGRNCEARSIDIVIFTDGQTVDMLVGAGADNGAAWQEHGVLSDWADWWRAPTNPD